MTLNIALISATPIETGPLRQHIDPEPGQDLKVIFEGELHGHAVIFTHCDVGKVNAAHSSTLIFENYNIDLVILFGIGGAYPHSGLKIGDVAVAESENYAEEGVLVEEGWKSMEFTGFPLFRDGRDYYNTFPLDRKYMDLTVETLTKSGFNAYSGNFITVSQCSGTQDTGNILEKRFSGICENTEGAAVAHMCALYGKRLIELRSISNIVENRDMKKWNIPQAVSNCNKAVIELVKKLG